MSNSPISVSGLDRNSRRALLYWFLTLNYFSIFEMAYREFSESNHVNF
jgi:hypothetical protein